MPIQRNRIHRVATKRKLVTSRYRLHRAQLYDDAAQVARENYRTRKHTIAMVKEIRTS